MAKYAALVSSASEGAVTTGRRMTTALRRRRSRRRRDRRVHGDPDHRGMTVRIGFKTSPQDVDWATLDATWARAGELDGARDAVRQRLAERPPDEHGRGERPGRRFEALTLLATLVHHVPGMTVGHAVLSNTFRHPVLVAKAAIVLDHATGGRFVLGLGAGWFEGEHEPFGIELPPIGQRIDRLEAAVETIRALFSDEAAAPPGVTRDDPFYPLAGAVCAPPPRTSGGPAAVSRRPGSARDRARRTDGRRLAPARDPRRQRALLRGEAGRDPAPPSMRPVGTRPASTWSARSARARRQPAGARRSRRAVSLVAAGATHVVLGMPARARAARARRGGSRTAWCRSASPSADRATARRCAARRIGR